MLFVYELKKLWRRVSPLTILIILLVTSVLTISVTAIFFNKAPKTVTDVSAKYTTLANKINNWNTDLNRDSFAVAFNDFYSDYKKMNTSTFNGDGLIDNYKIAQSSFNKFYIDYYQKYINGNENNVSDYLLVKKVHITHLDDIMSKLDAFFQANYVTNTGILQGLKNTNNAWEDANLQTILDDLFYIQTINENDLKELKQFFAKYPAEKNDFNYTNAYEYGVHKYFIAIETSSNYQGHLSQYEGFSEYQNTTVSEQACKLADFRLNHPEEDFSKPYVFGNIYNLHGDQISLFDFVFTNMEMAMIIISILIMIWAASVFFTDSYQNTLITPITAGKKRSTIILTKMLVVILLAVITILIFTGIYITAGLLLFRAYFSPDILFLLNGNSTIVMSAANYYVLYFLSLTFKVLPIIAVCGLVSFTKTKPFVIIGLTALIYTLVAILNISLSRFAFYEYVPLLGLNPINYCGAELLLSNMPNTYNIWLAFPTMFGITILLYLLLIQKFRRHDFY